MSSPQQNQKCKDCNKVQPLTREYFGSTPSGGFRKQCRSCMREHVKNYDSLSDERKEAAKGRAAKRSDFQFSQTEREQISQRLARRDGGTICFYCKSKLTSTFHIDHKTPIIKGGTHELSNWALACVQCNQEKHNKDIDEYRAWRRLNRLMVRF